MSPSPNFKHQRIAAELIRRIGNALADARVMCRHCRVVGEIDWHVAPDTVVRPDVLITCSNNPDQQHLTAPPEFIAEILSPSTAHKDRTAKRQLYQEQKVRHYWLIDPERETVEALELQSELPPTPTRSYQTIPVAETTSTFQISSDCTIEMSFADLFR